PDRAVRCLRLRGWPLEDRRLPRRPAQGRLRPGHRPPVRRPAPCVLREHQRSPRGRASVDLVGCMMLRGDYANPVIADLYLVHELYHAGTMPYIPGMGRPAFDEKMVRNELEASVLSEIQVYFEMPDLRAS